MNHNHRRVEAIDSIPVNLQTVKSFTACIWQWKEFLQNEKWKGSALICSYFTCNNFLFSLSLSLWKIVELKKFYFTLRKGKVLLEHGLHQRTVEKLFGVLTHWGNHQMTRILHTHRNNRNIIRMWHHSCGHSLLEPLGLMSVVWIIRISLDKLFTSTVRVPHSQFHVLLTSSS